MAVASLLDDVNIYIYIYIYIYIWLVQIEKSKYFPFLLSLDSSTLPLIRTLYCRVLSKEASSTIFKVFDMTRPGIERRSPGHWRALYPLGQ